MEKNVIQINVGNTINVAVCEKDYIWNPSTLIAKMENI